jgi:lactonase
MAVNPDGSGLRTIIPPEAGYMPNALVFDAGGGFYFTDFRGSSTDPTGVLYASPDLSTSTPVLPRLAMANGVAFSPDGSCGQRNSPAISSIGLNSPTPRPSPQ